MELGEIKVGMGQSEVEEVGRVGRVQTEEMNGTEYSRVDRMEGERRRDQETVNRRGLKD